MNQIFIECVTDGREMIYRAYHRPTGIKYELRYPARDDPARVLSAIRSKLLAHLGELVMDRIKVTGSAT